jgi:hypothetical protein
LDDIPLVNNEPMEEIVPFQVVGKEAPLPQTV